MSFKTTKEYITNCSYCKKENIETINIGYPISGDNYVCPTCKRTNADMYDDKKGLVIITIENQWISRDELYKILDELTIYADQHNVLLDVNELKERLEK